MAAISNINYAAGQDTMQDVFDKTNEVIDAVNEITFDATLGTKIVNIGDWNMDANTSVMVTHGVADYKKIRGIQIIIRNDADSAYFHFPYANSASEEGGVSSISSTLITINRETGGAFDDPTFSTTSYNRGFVTITYEI